MALPLFSNLKNKSKANTDTYITIVSGLPRSGTSMMMKMLASGGMELLTDDLRIADINNPKGYYELERVKKLKEGDKAWVGEAQGKVVKVISALLEYLPEQYTYKIIFMRRTMSEILNSQRAMLTQRGEATDKVSDERLTELYQKHLEKIEKWLNQQKNMEVIYISYNDILEKSEENIHRINGFLENRLDIEKTMGVIDMQLYRQRRSES